MNQNLIFKENQYYPMCFYERHIPHPQFNLGLITAIFILLLAILSTPFQAKAENDDFYVVTIDSAVNIWPNPVMGIGRFIEIDKPSIVYYGEGRLSVLSIRNGSARMFTQFEIHGKLANIIVLNLDSDPLDEMIFLSYDEMTAELSIYGLEGQETVLRIPLYTRRPDETGHWQLDLKVIVLSINDEPFLIGHVRTYYQPKGPRLIFGLSLGDSVRLAWVKRVKESFECIISLPTEEGPVAVLGGHATLNRMYFDGQEHIDDTSVLLAIDRYGNELARDELRIPNPLQPDKPGFMHTWVRIPPMPRNEDPMVVVLKGSIEYKEVDGRVSCLRLDPKRKKWSVVDSARFRVDEFIYPLEPGEDGVWRFCTKSSDDGNLAILSYLPGKYPWTLHKIQGTPQGMPQQILTHFSSVADNRQTALFISKYQDETLLEALSCNEPHSFSLLRRFKGASVIIESLRMTTKDSPPELMVWIDTPKEVASEYDHNLGTKVVYWLRVENIRSGHANVIILAIVGGILLLAAAFSIIKRVTPRRISDTIIEPKPEPVEREEKTVQSAVDFSSPTVVLNDVEIKQLIDSYLEFISQPPPPLKSNDAFGISPLFCQLRRDLEDLYKSDIAALRRPVLIWGEVGTGKSHLARSIHHLAFPDQDRQFEPLNASAIPETLIESELFGTVRGAAHGAVDRMGLIEEAEGGTLFLDEAQAAPLSLQNKLLLILQDGTFRRLGEAGKVRKAQVHWIIAMSENPVKLVDNGTLLRPFKDRISVHSYRIPPLRERREDILPLCDYLLRQVLEFIPTAKRPRYMNRFRAEREIYRRLLTSGHPENIRGLDSFIQRLVVKLEGIEQVSLSMFERCWDNMGASSSTFAHIMQKALMVKEPARSTLAKAGITTVGELLIVYREASYSRSKLLEEIKHRAGVSVGRNTLDRLFNETENLLNSTFQSMDKNKFLNSLQDYLNEKIPATIFKHKPFRFLE